MTSVRRQRRTLRAAAPRLVRRGVLVRFAMGRRVIAGMSRARGYWARRIGLRREFAGQAFVRTPRPVIAA